MNREQPMRLGDQGSVPIKWQLWRQDDNGNRFLVDEFADRAAAERRMAELTQYIHKQTYWICEDIGKELH